MKALWKLFTYLLNALGHKACSKSPWSCHCYGVKLNYFYNACCTLAKGSLFPQLTEVEGLKNKWIKEDQKSEFSLKGGKNPFFLKCEEGKLKQLSSKCQPGTHSHCFKREMDWLAGEGLIIVKNIAFAVCLIFLLVVIDKCLVSHKESRTWTAFLLLKMAVGYCRVADHKVSSLLICVLLIGMDIKWMRLSKPEVSIKTRQAYTQSILPIPPTETLPHIPSWKTSQALLLLLYHLNKGLWLALLIPDARYAFVTQYNNKTALAIHCFTLEIAECPLEAQASPRESSVLPTYHLQDMKRMQQSTWTCLTSFLNSARSPSEEVLQCWSTILPGVKNSG